MKLRRFLKDKLYSIIISIFGLIIMFLILLAFKVDKYILVSLLFIFIICSLINLCIDYFRKKKFYTYLLDNIECLDKAYLVLETLEKPEFYDGEILYQALYEINKSFLENINKREKMSRDFKEYVEMWIHEVKLPLSALSLMINNHKNKLNKEIKKQIKRLEDYVEQVLYYVRSENAAKDFYINKVNLGTIIKNIGLKNMTELLESKIEFITSNVNVFVYSDSKWLEFIIGQIVNNAIKYKKENANSYIKISTTETKNDVTLFILDNGVGISSTDIRQVFNKSFTGENGRNKTTSTGMGLFIAKNMCEKLGAKIAIESVLNEFTKVSITFSKNEFYEVIK